MRSNVAFFTLNWLSYSVGLGVHSIRNFICHFVHLDYSCRELGRPIAWHYGDKTTWILKRIMGLDLCLAEQPYYYPALLFDLDDRWEYFD